MWLRNGGLGLAHSGIIKGGLKLNCSRLNQEEVNFRNQVKRILRPGQWAWRVGMALGVGLPFFFGLGVNPLNI